MWYFFVIVGGSNNGPVVMIPLGLYLQNVLWFYWGRISDFCYTATTKKAYNINIQL